MRHRNHSNRLGRKPDQARLLLKNLLTSILLYEHVRTTKKRAQVVRPLVDRAISIGKRDRTDLAIRKINRMVTDKNACRKIIEVFKPRYAQRSSGFTRMTPAGQRGGDGAFLVDIVLLDAAAPVTESPVTALAPKAKSAPKKTKTPASSKKAS